MIPKVENYLVDFTSKTELANIDWLLINYVTNLILMEHNS